ncbi:PREDICTED: 1-acyl-sn-glycerol-3-phosphate acyltransferase 2-like isoform X1 [Ipomoea nil]|uniref:1-acyl-sn-glycerol-3-phosphate acyltransferase 2-like isoform X1 n=1 Tax=Ipomoea nil TaxID=35883 RepID=UPI000901C12B|nr:PREDICTED: 1-acyl-sn-glycerol-3-phosphate acyltransferase 2-like isoform X1 [Ipomoea nil]
MHRLPSCRARDSLKYETAFKARGQSRRVRRSRSAHNFPIHSSSRHHIHTLRCFDSVGSSGMAIAAAAVIVPVGVLFFISGLFTNAIQAICYVVIRPFSKSTYRRINRLFAELLWLELVWLIDWWAGVKVQLYTDPETFKLMGKEHALLISNHRSDIDWVVGWVLAQRSGCLGSTLAVMKKSSVYLPVIGWSMFFSEYLFLERSWAKDESTLKSGLKRLQDYPLPFWLALFVEGTRFTQAKLLAAQEYAASTGLPIPRNVLIPRTKGFVTAVNHMRSFVPAIYEVTVAIPKSSPAPTMLRIFKGQPSVVHIHMKRHMMKDLPENDDDIAQWCRDVFVAKDKLLDKHITEDSFGEEKLQNIGRPAKSLVVVVSWACLLIVGAIKLFQSSPLLSSWKGITVSATLLAVITILMQILINFTQLERSTPAKVAPAKRQNGKKVVENGQRKDE